VEGKVPVVVEVMVLLVLEDVFGVESWGVYTVKIRILKPKFHGEISMDCMNK
jgi:hypothetical protein